MKNVALSGAVAFMILAVVSGPFGLSEAHADSAGDPNGQPCLPSDASAPSIRVPNGILKRLAHLGQDASLKPDPNEDSTRPSWLSAEVRGYYEVTGGVNNPSVQKVGFAYGDQNTLSAYFDLLLLNPKSPTLVQDYQNLLGTEVKKRNMSSADSLALLQLLGQDFVGQYKASPQGFTAATPPSQVIGNWLVNGGQGGVCRDIHDVLGLTAKALGFQDVTELSGMWGKGDQAAHAIEAYRDPKTGDFYLQNYATIVDTHIKDLSALLGAETRLLGGMDQDKFVTTQDRSGQVHEHVVESGYAEEAWKLISQASVPEGDGKAVHAAFDYGNLADHESFQVGHSVLGDGYISAFATRERNQVNPQDPVTMTAEGVAASYDHDFTKNGKVIVNVHADATAGHLDTDFQGLIPGVNSASPLLAPQRDPFTFARSDFGVAIPMTNRLDVNAGVSTRSFWPGDTFSDFYTYAGVGYQVNASTRVDWTRVIQFPPTTAVDLSTVVRSAYDRVSVFYDTTRGKVHLSVNGRVYLFAGAEKLSAVGLYDLMKAEIPTTHWGDFVVYASVGKVANHLGDPWYEVPVSASAGLAWSKTFSNHLTLSAYDGYRLNGRQDFQEFTQDEIRVPASATFGPTGPAPIAGDNGPTNEAGVMFKLLW